MFVTTVWNRFVHRVLRRNRPVSPAAHPDYEGVLERVYRNLLRPGDVAVDVGAHIGRHTICMAQQVGPTGKVHAFEPIPFCQQAIRDMLAHPTHAPLQGVVALSPLALGAAPAQTEFVLAVDSPGYSGLKERVYDAPTRLEKFQVQVETLDRVLADLLSCRFVKVDAEGGEYDILRGGSGILGRLRPVVGFEFGMASCSGYSVQPGDMDDLWRSLGYELYDIKGRRLSREDFITSSTIQNVWDYFAVPAEQTALARLVQRRCRG